MPVTGLFPNVYVAREWSAIPLGDVHQRVDMTSSLEKLVELSERVSRGDLGHAEAVLTAQTVTLNALFVNLADRANKSQLFDHFERYLRLAFKAQSQCRTTCETLAPLKNPPVFTRQANTASQQFVNNGTMVTASRAGNSENVPNGLLEAHGERLDGGEAARQADAIRVWRPWERSTGPRTAEGKARASRNAYLGGGTPSGDASDVGNAIAVDVAGNVLVTGEAGSTNFPMAGNPFQTINAGGADAFVTRFQADSAPPPQPGPIDFYTLPCRLIDTRNANALLGGPALYANTNRNFVIVGRCGIPPSAKAVSLNITATAQTAQGHFRLYPGGTTPPTASSLNYMPGRTRANNAIVMLGPLGDFGARCVQASGTAHLVVDVNGYFQ